MPMINVAYNSVQSWQADMMGHMNAQFYLELATQGLAGLGVHLGLGPRFINREGTRLFAREHHARWLVEQRVGAPLTVRAGILEVRDFSLRVYEELVNSASGEVAATFNGEIELLDVETRETRPIPAKAKEAAKKLLMELPEHGKPRGLEMTPPRPAPTLAEADAMGFLPATFQGDILSAACDAQGFLYTQGFLGLLSASIPNMFCQAFGEDRSKPSKFGGAVLEYRLVYRKYPRVGDVVTLRSGLKQLGSKTYTWCHWIFDTETGEALATTESLGLRFDLETRKSIPLPEELQKAMAQRVISGLSV